MPGTLLVRSPARWTADTPTRIPTEHSFYADGGGSQGSSPLTVPGLESWFSAGVAGAAKTMGGRVFDGSTEYFTITDGSQTGLDPESNSFSIGMWILPTDFTANNGLVGKGITSNAGYDIIIRTTGKMKIRIGDGTNTAELTNTSTTLVVDTPYWLLFEFDRTDDLIRVWINNVLDGTTQDISSVTDAVNSTATFSLGNDGADYFAGTMAGVTFHNKVLTAVERDWMWNGGVMRSAYEVDSHETLGGFDGGASGTSVDMWPFNEASGGGSSVSELNDLTDNATVTAGDGPSILSAQDGTCPITPRVYNGDDQYHNLADNSTVSFTDQDMTIAVRFKAFALESTYLVSKWGNSGGNTDREYSLEILNNGTIRGAVGDGSSVGQHATAEVYRIDQWYTAFFWHDSVNDEIHIQLGPDGEDRSTNWSTGIQDGTADFYIGQSRTVIPTYFNGQIGMVALYARHLTDAEKLDFDNTGFGMTRESIAAHDTLSDYREAWPGDEGCGMRSAIGSSDNDMTHNGANPHVGTLTSFTAGGAQYKTDVAHGDYDPTAKDTSDNNNHGKLNHDHLEVWDKSGGGNVGTMTGFDDGLTPRITSLKTGASGKALRLNGTDEYVALTDSGLPTGASARTVSLWFRAHGTAASRGVLSYGANVIGQRFDINADTDQVFVAFHTHQWGATIESHGWNHLVAVVPDGAVNTDDTLLYLNGVQLTPSTLSGSVQTLNTGSGGDLYLGQNIWSGAFYDGDIDDVRIWSSALTAKEIKFLCEDYDGTPSEPLNDPGKPDAGWWDFEDDPRQSDTPWAIEDKSTNNNFGVPVGIKTANPLVTDVPAVLKDESSNENVGRFVGFTEADPRSTKTVALTLDSSSNSNHLSMVGFSGVLDPTVDPVEGATGTGVHFDGTDDNLTIGEDKIAQLFNGASASSVSGWVRYFSLTSGQYDNVVFVCRVGGVNAAQWVNIRGDVGNVGKLLVGGRSENGDSFQEQTHPTALTAGVWYHFTATFDYANDEIDVAIDGVFTGAGSVTFGQSTYTHGTPSANDIIGSTTGSGFLNGDVDDIRVFSDELSSNEALGLYNLHRMEPLGTGTNPGTGNLVSHYKLDKGDTRAIEFDGVDDYIPNTSVIDDITLSDPWTAEGWFFWNGDNNDKAFSFSDLDGNEFVGYGVDSSGKQKVFSNGKTSGSGSDPESDTWYHVALVWDGTQFHLYIDTSLDYSVTPSSAITWGDLDVLRLGEGENSATLADFWAGMIENFRVYGYALSTDEITYNRNERLGDSGGTAPTTGPVAHYKGENLLTASGKSMPFDGTDDVITMGDLSEFDGQSAFTLSAWVKYRSFTDFARWFGKGVSGASTERTQIGIGGSGQNDEVLINLASGADTSGVTTSGPIATGEWNHWAIVFDGGGAANADRLKLYINGVAETLSYTGTIPATTSSNAGDFVLGANRTDAGFGDLLLKDVQFYQEAADANEVTYIYENSLGLSGGTDPTTTNLAGHYTFNELSNEVSRVAADGSGNGRDAIVVNKDIGTALSTSVVDGATGSCLVNAVDEYARLDEHIAYFKNLQWGTIEIWFKTAGTAGDQTLFSLTDRGDADSEFTIKLTSAGVIDVNIENGGSAVLAFTASTGLDDDVWHQLVLAHGNGDVGADTNNALYIDGAAVTPSYTTGGDGTKAFFADIDDADTMRIGVAVRSDVLADHFEGSIDEVRIWSRYQLTANDALGRYELFRGQTLTGTNPGTTKLSGYWSFDALTSELSSQSVALNGADNEIRVESDDTNDQIWNGGGGFEIWFKPESDGEGDHGRLGSKSDPGNDGWETYVHDQSGEFCGIEFFDIFSGDDGNWMTTNRVVRIGVWNHFMMTYDDTDTANNPTFWVNGEELTVANSGITENTAPTGTAADDSGTVMYYGNRAAGDRSFAGLLRGGRLYNRTITSDEAAQRYAEGLRLHGGASSVEPPKGSIAQSHEFNESNERSVATLSGGLSLEFDGSDDYVTMGDVLNVTTNDFTISAWVNPDVVTNDGAFFRRITSNESAVPADGYGLSLNLGVPNVKLEDTHYTAANATALPVGEWSHVVYTVDRDGNATLYVNGKFVGVVSVSAKSGADLTTTKPFVLGVLADDLTNGIFDGKLDDVRTFHRILSATEVYDLYAGTDDRESLFGNWPFNVSSRSAGLQGDPVNCLSSQGGSLSLQATQIAQANRPTVVTGANGVNNKAALSFSGSPVSMEIDEATADVYYTIIAFKTGSSAFSGDHTILSFSDIATTNQYYSPLTINSSGNPMILWRNGGTETRMTAAGLTMAVSTTYIVETWSAFGKYWMKVNGTLYALTTTTGTNDGAVNFDDGDVTTIGALRTTITTKYAEMLYLDHAIFNQIPSVANRLAQRQYFASEYDVELAS